MLTPMAVFVRMNIASAMLVRVNVRFVVHVAHLFRYQLFIVLAIPVCPRF